MNTTFIPDELQNTMIREQLSADEMVRWAGQEPRSRYLVNRILGMVVIIIVALISGFISVVMLIMNPNIFQGSIRSILPLLIPVAIFGASIYGLARAIRAFIKGRPALYVVTNQRALVIEQGVTVDVKSYGAQAILAMQITRRRNGSGKIIFERNVSWDRDSEGRSQRRVVEIGFFGVPSVDEVCRHLRQITEAESTIKVGGEALPDIARFAVEPFDHFFALETSALHERLYKISIVDKHVCGAKIAGGFSSIGLKHMGEVSGYGFLFSPIADRVANGEQKRESLYQNINPLSFDFLTMDKANFRYRSLDIDHAAITEEYKTLDSGYNSSGRIEIHLRDGKTRKFWLTRNANPCSVAELFRANEIYVEESGVKQRP